MDMDILDHEHNGHGHSDGFVVSCPVWIHRMDMDIMDMDIMDMDMDRMDMDMMEMDRMDMDK